MKTTAHDYEFCPEVDVECDECRRETGDVRAHPDHGNLCHDCMGELGLLREDGSIIAGGPLCGYCKQVCSPIPMDFGVGYTEFWGAPGVDTDWRTVSDCCEAGVYEDSTFSSHWV